MMRFGRTMAVLVLGVGVIGGEIAAAEPEAPKYPPRVLIDVEPNPWTPIQLKPEHAILNRFVGKFTTTVHLYTRPDPRKRDTEGTAEGNLLMGGAFVQLTQADTRMKQSFQGMTIYGYDEVARKFTATSVDSASTVTVNLSGVYVAANKQITMSGTFSDTRAGYFAIIRTVTTFVDENTWTYDEFISHKAGGPETQVVTITFKRS